MTQEPREPGPDPVGDFQRWLFRSGARGMSREVGGQIRTAFGRNGSNRDVWANATSGTPGDEPPECAWCPLCRAARVIRESRPGVAAYLSAAGEAFASVAQEVASAVEAAIAAAGRRPSDQGHRPEPPGSPRDEPDDRG